MKHDTLQKELVPAIIFSSIYVLLKIFQYHIEKALPGVSVNTVDFFLLVVLVVLFVAYVVKILQRRKKTKGKIKLRFMFYLPAIVLAAAILYNFSPVKLSSESLESPVVFKACYEGSSIQALIRFRKNMNFEIYWKDENGNAEWFGGNYRQNRDTFFLTYFDKSPDKFGSIILNTGQMLKSLDKPHLVEDSYISFYLGTCR